MRTKRINILTAASIHLLCQYTVTGFVAGAWSISRISISGRLIILDGESKTQIEAEVDTIVKRTTCSRSTFQRFEDEVLERISSAQGSDTGQRRDDAVVWSSLVVRQDYLKRMATSSTDNNEERRSLARKMHNRGGYFVLELGKDEASTMNNLWTCAEDIWYAKHQSATVCKWFCFYSER